MAKDEQMDRGTVELIGALMTASARDLAWTNTQLLRSERARADDLHAAVNEIYHSLSKVPYEMRTTRVQAVIERMAFVLDLYSPPEWGYELDEQLDAAER